MQVLPSEITDWKNIQSQPRLLSTFDKLLLAYANAKGKVTDDLVSATLVYQRYLGYLWTDLQSRLNDYRELYNTLHFMIHFNRVVKTWFQSWNLEVSTETFRRLVFAKAAIEIMGDGIVHNMRVLRLGSPNSTFSESDIESWEALKEIGSSLRQKISGLMDAYVQEAGLQENQLSNYQARNIGRLTSLATILVPLSVTAGMFSMGGEFLPGESKFWIFWAVTAPMILVLSLLLFAQGIQSLGRMAYSIILYIFSCWHTQLQAPFGKSQT
jgi:hypothetical protein